GIRDFHVTGVQTCALPIYNNNVVLQSSINNNPMKSTLKELIAKNKELEKSEALTKEAEINDPAIKDSRREFLKRTALGGISLGRSEERRVGKSVDQGVRRR